jgi:hypothetical protein
MSVSVGCQCGTVHGNTGLPNCVELFGKALGYGIVSLRSNTNTENFISLDPMTMQTSWNQMLINRNRTKRLFPVTELRNVTQAVEDTQFATDNAGGKVRTRRGFKSINYEKWEVSDVFVGKLQQGECNANGAYLFSAKGIQGIRIGNVLLPIPIEAYDNKFMPADDANPSKLMGSFQYAPTVQDGDLWMITWEELGINYNTQVSGMIDANFVVVDEPTVTTGTTTFTVALTTDYGVNNPYQSTVEGLQLSQFTAKDLTDGVDVELDDLTIDPLTNNYTFSYSQTVPTDNTVEVTLFTAMGYEGYYKFEQPA